MTQDIYIGTMSGTSIDGLDIAACDFDSDSILLASHCFIFPDKLKKQLSELADNETVDYSTLGKVNREYSEFCVKSINQFIDNNNLDRENIRAIGHHGQTIHHAPEHHITLQLTDNHFIATHTKLCVVGDIRQKDLAHGGQGAPLAPYLHMQYAKPNTAQIILNLGGIANITAIDENNSIMAFDTGPANGLMDAWILKHQNKPFDDNGAWAQSGSYNSELLLRLKQQPYFQMPAPKSTGRELFNLQWLEEKLSGLSISPEDVQATLLLFTVETICDAIKQVQPQTSEIYVCGGGTNNRHLLSQLEQKLNIKIESTDVLGIDPEWLEACAFAMFAKYNLENHAIDLSSITGSNQPVLLGARYYP